MIKKSGWVYFGESKRKDGSKKIYIGQTKRTPYKRWGEHMSEVKKTNSNTWTGKGEYFKPLGAFWSTNRYKAEKTVKRFSPTKKRAMARYGARKYKS